ncbi:MFS transporter [Nonomuraea sp. SYSU D8015]|uniref:MFS transporter n=1 Tax=Nonomuraea sp. SYSU D8015 TaxID=2593644 RepID=UPI001660217C|nr:MFS transporter [Nonomuraea sp. SYSU D8015]
MDGAGRWTGLAVLASVALLLSIDVSVLYLALPRLSADLGATASQQLWIVDVYSFMLAGFLITMGTLGDRIGRRRLLMIGAAAFGAASVLAACSVNAETLIATRALLGVSGATLLPSSLALIRNMFHDVKQMGTAIGLWYGCFMLGMAVGPLVGGVLLEHFRWGSVFLMGVPFMALVLVAGRTLLPEYRDPAAGRLDLAGVALSLAMILPVVYGLKEIARSGWDPVAVAAMAAGAAFGVAFVRRQRRLADPLLDLRLFANRAFAATLGIMLLSGIVMAGTTLMTTQYLQTVQALSPPEAGLWLVPQNIAMILALTAAPAIARRVGAAHVMAAGLALGAAGLFLHTQVPSAGGTGLVVTGLVLASAGIALPMGVGSGVMMTAAPPEKAGYGQHRRLHRPGRRHDRDPAPPRRHHVTTRTAPRPDPPAYGGARSGDVATSGEATTDPWPGTERAVISTPRRAGHAGHERGMGGATPRGRRAHGAPGEGGLSRCPGRGGAFLAEPR